jgi:hypothetical protein
MRPEAPIEGPAAWYGPNLAARPQEWTYTLTPREIDEVEDALISTKHRQHEIADIRPADFPLPTLGPLLHDMRRELLHGRGFVLLRGLSVDRSVADAARAFWGICAWFGRPRPQNAQSHLLGHVQDLGHDLADPHVRVYQTNRRQTYHTDSCDLVGLLCIKTARRGGLSSIVSSVTVFNEILRRQPDLVPTLFEPYPTDRRGEIPAGMLSYFPMPIYHWYHHLLSAIYSRTYILSSQRLPEAPRLTAAQLAAMSLVDALAEDPALHLMMDFQPGDIQLLHNHQLFHDRTAFEDWPEPERRRHLLRIWLCPPDGRPLPRIFAARYGRVTIGDRGGISVPNAREVVPVD